MENAVYYISVFGDFLCSLSPHTFLTYSIDTSIVFMGSSLYHQCLSLFVDLFDRFATGNKLFAVFYISCSCRIYALPRICLAKHITKFQQQIRYREKEQKVHTWFSINNKCWEYIRIYLVYGWVVFSSNITRAIITIVRNEDDIPTVHVAVVKLLSKYFFM